MDFKIVLQGIKNDISLNQEERLLVSRLSEEYSTWVKTYH